MNAESLRFPKCCKLRKPAEFSAVYAEQCRSGDQFLLVFALRNQLGWTRCGLSVSRNHGGAVQRNRLKRQLREVFRLTRHDLPVGLDLILIPRKKSGASLSDFQSSLKKLAGKLERRVQQS